MSVRKKDVGLLDVAGSDVERIPPLPIRPLAALAFVLFANSINMSILFPFSIFMVRDFGITEDEREWSSYAGLLAGAFFLGRAFTSYLWGHLADVFGRKPVIYTGLVTQAYFGILFGLAPSFGWATTLRLLAGALNGIIGTAKAVAGDLCGKHHQARGITLISATWSLGLVIGPAVGGLLTGAIASAPYLAPMLFSGGLSAIGFVLAQLYLPETRSVDSLAPTPKLSLSSSSSRLLLHEERPLFPSRLRRLVPFCSWRITNILGLYSIFSFIDMMFSEVYSFYCVTSAQLGGLSFSAAETGLAMSIVGVFTSILNIYLFPFAEKRMGATRVYWTTMIISAPLFILFPFVNLALQIPWLCWTLLILIGTLKGALVGMTFTANFMIINNSVTTKYRARVNGIGMMAGSLFKAFGPSIGGIVFTWSLKSDIGYPVDIHFVFHASALLLLVCAAWARTLSSDLDKPIATNPLPPPLPIPLPPCSSPSLPIR